MIRVHIPAPLILVSGADAEVALDVQGEATIGALLDALEARYPALKGTIRDHATNQRRPFLRFFACGKDLSQEPADAALPAAVVAGHEPFFVIAAVAGG